MKRYTKKIILLKKTFIKDNFQEIIQHKIFFKFLDYINLKGIKDMCYIYKIRAKKEACLKEAILRTKIIDCINIWEIGNAFNKLIDNKKQLLLK